MVARIRPRSTRSTGTDKGRRGHTAQRGRTDSRYLGMGTPCNPPGEGLVCSGASGVLSTALRIALDPCTVRCTRRSRLGSNIQGYTACSPPNPGSRGS